MRRHDRVEVRVEELDSGMVFAAEPGGDLACEEGGGRGEGGSVDAGVGERRRETYRSRSGR